MCAHTKIHTQIFIATLYIEAESQQTSAEYQLMNGQVKVVYPFDGLLLNSIKK